MYTMMQVCRETNLTYETLKFYCNEGMVPNVKRDRNNRRIFDEQDVKWIQDLVCLKPGATPPRTGSPHISQTFFTPSTTSSPFRFHSFDALFSPSSTV